MQRMPWGKYRGAAIRTLPDSYLWWLYGRVDLKQPLLNAIRFEVFNRFPQKFELIYQKSDQFSANNNVDVRKVKSIFRRLAQKYHPDHGGDNASMAALNEFYELLTGAVDS